MTKESMKRRFQPLTRHALQPNMTTGGSPNLPLRTGHNPRRRHSKVSYGRMCGTRIQAYRALTGVPKLFDRHIILRIDLPPRLCYLPSTLHIAEDATDRLLCAHVPTGKAMP